MHLALLLALLALLPDVAKSMNGRGILAVPTFTVGDQLESPPPASSEGETRPSPVYIDPLAPKEPLAAPVPDAAASFLTTTVYGFLDFVTTIGNTVMVFTPQTAPPSGEKVKVSVVGGQEVLTVISSSAAPKTTLVTASKSQQLSSNIKASASPSSKINKEDNKVLLKKSEPRVVVSIRTSSSSSEEEDKGGGHSSPKLEGSEPLLAAGSSPSSVTVLPSVETSFLIDDDVQTSVASASPTPPLNTLQSQVRTQVQTAVRVASSEASPTAAPKPQQQKLPTGLVTTLDATLVADGITTLMKTSVIGTFFDGKYAQILHSTAVILGGASPVQPTPLLSVLDNSFDGEDDNGFDDAEASASEERTLYVLPEESASPTATVTRRHLSPPASRRPSSAFSLRRGSSRSPPPPPPPPTTSKAPPKSYQKSFTPRSSFRNRFTNPTPPTPPQRVSTVSVFASPSAPSRRSFQPSRTRSFAPSRRGFSPKEARSPPTTTPQSYQDVQPTPALRFKPPRNSGRWRYEPSPKPRVNIQKTEGTSPPQQPTTPTSPTPLTPAQQPPPEVQKEIPLQESSSVSTSVSTEDEDDLQELIVGAEAETIRVTTTRAPLHDDDDDEVLLQVATIKSPYVFQAGAVKNTRFITLTHTQSLRLLQTVDPSLTENLLATTQPIENILQGSHDVATLPPLTLIDNGDGITQATPALETVTQTLSTAELLLKTSVLPVVRLKTAGDESPSTSFLTLTQSYFVTRLVTAMKTLPALEYYQYAPDRTLTEFNTLLQESGSEHREHVTDADDNPPNLKKVLPPPDLVSVGSPFDPSAMDNLQHIGSVPNPTPTSPPTPPPTPPPPPPPPVHPYFNYFNPFAPYINPVPPVPRQEPVVMTTSRPVIRTSTLYDTHIIAITPPSGGGPTYSTITRPTGTTTITDYVQDTVTQLANPVAPGYQPQYTLTSSPVLTSVTVTVTNSKVLKLQFGARTTLTTIFSTSLVPTMTTVYVTTSAPVQPTAGYNPYFPAPQFPLPFLG